MNRGSGFTRYLGPRHQWETSPCVLRHVFFACNPAVQYSKDLHHTHRVLTCNISRIHRAFRRKRPRLVARKLKQTGQAGGGICPSVVQERGILHSNAPANCAVSTFHQAHARRLLDQRTRAIIQCGWWDPSQGSRLTYVSRDSKFRDPSRSGKSWVSALFQAKNCSPGDGHIFVAAITAVNLTKSVKLSTLQGHAVCLI